MNTSIIKSVPPGDFEEISIHLPDWEAKFLSLAQQGKPIKYGLYSMPTIPQNVQVELGRKSYSCLVLEEDDWQYFLVPRTK